MWRQRAGWGVQILRRAHVSPRAFALALLLTLLGGSAAVAFTVTSGFTAAVYANAPSAAVAGVAFSGGSVYAVDPAAGAVYRGSGAAPVSLAPVASLARFASLAGAPTGIAVSGGQLYVARNAAGDVVRLDPVTAAWTSVAAIGCPNAIATDPASGDLFVSSCTSLFRVSAPATTATVSRYADVVPGGFTTYGIAFSADGYLYAVAPSNGTIYRVAGPAPTRTLTTGAIGTVPGARGVAVVGDYLFVSASDSSITKLPIPELAQAALTALAGGDPGDLDLTGPDGCVYASQGAAVVRLGDASGGCALAAAAPPPPPATLTLARISTTQPLVGGGDQTFTATLANATAQGGVAVTFAVSGANSRTVTTTTAPNGIATFAYTATTTGTDTIVATATVNGTTLTSNALTLDWPRAFDSAPPTITYAVTGTQGGSFGCPRADVGTPGVTEYCGWYTSPPTLTWTVTANGPSGIDTTATQCPPFALAGSSPITGTPVTCIAYNGDGTSAALQVRLLATATPPTITAHATTSDGAPYAAATPTALPVTVTFDCVTALGPDGLVGCTPPVTVSAPGVTTVLGTVVDIAGTTRTTTFVVDIATQSTTTRITSMLVARGGSVSARLVGGDGIAPVVGRTITFAAGGLTATGVTGANGVATATLALASGQYALTAAFAGDATDLASADASTLTVYETTRFVVWSARATVGASVQLYGDDWASQIGDAQARKPFDHFKGYAATATATVWTGTPGDTTKAPRTVARYVAVIATTGATRRGELITGDVARIVVVRVDGDGKHGYDGRVGDRLFGTVVGSP